jgi:hypothetical protein
MGADNARRDEKHTRTVPDQGLASPFPHDYRKLIYLVLELHVIHPTLFVVAVSVRGMLSRGLCDGG